MIVSITTMRARDGQVEKLTDVLTALVAASRTEAGCVQFDCLTGEEDPLEFALYGRWASASAFNAHLRASHIDVLHSLSDELTDRAPQVVAYTVLETNRRLYAGDTRPLDAADPQV